MTAPFDPKAATASLRDFQRATVEHVATHLFRPDGSRRFLVADETGLGKSLVARGLVAETIARFEHDDSINRIDIVYVCSSTELARQNLERLDCLGLLDRRHRISTDRLSLLALAGDDFNRARPELGVTKPVNLVAFTPVTSFDHGHAWGQSRERALIVRMIADFEELTDAQWRRLKLVFTGNAKKGFEWTLQSVENSWSRNGINTEILDDFKKSVRRDGSMRRLRRLLDDIGKRRSLDEALTERSRTLCSQFRRALARSSVTALQPDLVILDEFQRFRSLLDRESGPTAELAHDLFDHQDAHVLLLSATPYKPYTLATERGGEHDEEHYRDLIATLRFLARDDAAPVDDIERDLAEFRRTVSSGENPSELAERIGDRLRQLMVRTERPPSLIDAMIRTVEREPGIASAADFVEHVRLRELAATVSAALPVDYWKSVPLFANHIDGYDLGRRVKLALTDRARAGSVTDRLRKVPAMTANDDAGPVDPGNARFRSLNADLIESGVWRLPWLPPSLPYLEPDGPWADPALAGVTKRLLFSNWAAVPASVTTLLSHNASWAATRGRTIHPRLQYRVSEGRPGGMTTMAMFWPHPALAELVDPLRLRRQRGRPINATDVLDAGADAIRATVPSTGDAGGRHAEWESYFAFNGSTPSALTGDAERTELALFAMLGVTAPAEFEKTEHSGIDRHYERLAATREQTMQVWDDHIDALAQMAAFSPANTAWRALKSVVRADDQVDSATAWVAAAVIADGLRSLLNRTDVACALDDDPRFAQDTPYWRRVLQTCADGNLQAVLEEYLAHERPPNSASFTPVGASMAEFHDHGLVELAHKVRGALALRESTLRLFDPTNPNETLGRQTRFAVRYGGKIDRTDDTSARLGEVRAAFNSPFWPYVLASTSVGQEGIDFHWWCHAIVHWNLPASPVDFEQREGRVNRFGGHAVRRNVAAEHGARALTAAEAGRPVWESLWELARDRRHEHGDLSPEWVYTGPHQVERHVFPYALSRDEQQLERLERARALYRLAFGQPRQEDMLKLLEQCDFDVETLRIDLRPDGTRRSTSVK